MELNSVHSLTPVDTNITLNEFCTRLSSTDRRVELIAAFFHVENAAGIIKDDESNFQSRFLAFANQPV